MNEKSSIRIGENSIFYYSPTQELKSCIQYYIHLNYISDKLNNTFIHPFPNGEVEFYFHIGDSEILIQENGKTKSLKHLITGYFDKPSYVYIKPVCSEKYYNCIIVPIKLSSLCNVANISIVKLKNKILDIEEIWGKDALHLKLILNSNLKVNECIKQINIFLLKFFCKNINRKKNKIFHLIDYCIKKEGKITVEDLASVFNLSYRTIHRIFTKQLGICPKEYLRIVRFNKVCSLLKKYPFVDWPEIAYSCGFYDQSHFIHDFKHFMKVSPEEFVNRLNNNYYLAHPIVFSS